MLPGLRLAIAFAIGFMVWLAMESLGLLAAPDTWQSVADIPAVMVGLVAAAGGWRNAERISQNLFDGEGID